MAAWVREKSKRRPKTGRGRERGIRGGDKVEVAPGVAVDWTDPRNPHSYLPCGEGVSDGCG